MMVLLGPDPRSRVHAFQLLGIPRLCCRGGHDRIPHPLVALGDLHEAGLVGVRQDPVVQEMIGPRHAPEGPHEWLGGRLEAQGGLEILKELTVRLIILILTGPVIFVLIFISIFIFFLIAVLGFCIILLRNKLNLSTYPTPRHYLIIIIRITSPIITA